MEEFVVRKKLIIRAPMQDVWQAITNPELTKKYFFGCRVRSMWNVGGEIAFERKILWVFPMVLRGKILEIDKGSLLKYSLSNSRSESESIVTIDLYEDAGKTIVSVSDDVGSGESAADRYERSLAGWDKILTGLKKVVETELSYAD